ncbi:AI-2E family transporter [Bacteroides sp. 224]|uniref:AI-2E family transporter n=1 Tax=Bacteroides sp. 224 TaxID=2302936 RepID=UPI0013D7DC93|nr:AI-2E family transporter [Bacteroides sp. 224]NDV64856.1 AI-2E family transporter [Bacteroides sp. 224]
MEFKYQYRKYSLIAMLLITGIAIFTESIPYLGGLLGAMTIYILLRKQMSFLVEKKKFRKSWAAILLLIETILFFLIPLSVIVILLVGKISSMEIDAQFIIDPAQRIVDFIKEKTGYNLFEVKNMSSVVSLIPRIGQYLMNGISSFAINIFVLIFVLFFMLIGGKKMEQYIYEILPFSNENKKEVLRETNLIVTSNAIGIPLLAIIQGGIALVGYYIFDAPAPWLLGILTAFATIIPMVGTTIVWLPVVVYMALTGNWTNAIGLMIFAVLIITQVDNLIRFILQKKMADTHPLITIFGVVIGLTLFGFMGVIFGPLLLSMFILLFNIFKKEYLGNNND